MKKILSWICRHIKNWSEADDLPEDIPVSLVIFSVIGTIGALFFFLLDCLVAPLTLTEPFWRAFGRVAMYGAILGAGFCLVLVGITYYSKLVDRFTNRR